MALTCEAMDQAGCGTPNCTHDHQVLFLRSTCHPGASTDVAYVKRTGTLRILCHRCERLITEIKVARTVN
jgi:hypothetical protein